MKKKVVKLFDDFLASAFLCGRCYELKKKITIRLKELVFIRPDCDSEI